MGAVGRALPRPRIALPSGPPRRTVLRAALVFAMLGAALSAGYLLWFKHSSFVAVEQVRVSGADERPDIAVALEQAGLGQSTLAVDREALEAAVAGDPAVAGLRVSGDFPDALEVRVELRTPAGWLAEGGAVVAADGVVLERDGAGAEDLPRIAGAGPRGGRVDGEALEIARVLGAAPPPLLAEVGRAKMTGDHGVIAEIGPGIELRFGSRAKPERKWEAAAAVLADRQLENVAYLDLSVPERPVAGTAE
jgi:cell division septal protein FtsQ